MARISRLIPGFSAWWLLASVSLVALACDSSSESRPESEPAATRTPGATIESIPAPGTTAEPAPATRSTTPPPPTVREPETPQPCRHPEAELPTAKLFTRGASAGDALVTVYLVVETRDVSSARIHNEWVPAIVDGLGDRVRVVERVVASRDDSAARRAIRAFGVAQQEGALGRFSDRFFEAALRGGADGAHLEPDALKRMASGSGISGIDFEKALVGPRSEAVLTEMDTFLKRSGRTELPALFVNGVEWTEPFELERVLAALEAQVEACAGE